MNSVGKIQLKKIKRISPSQFYSMKNCAYKSLLAEAFEKKPLLPVSANAYLGTVLHKELEMIIRGEIKSESDLIKSFEQQIASIEERLVEQGYDFFVPLHNNVKDYGMKIILLKKHIKNIEDRPPVPIGVRYFSEKWFESKDALIAGKIDLVIESENEIEIVDFKTGAITEDVLDDSGEVFSAIKGEYSDQLKLYAYLYYENTGKFPSSLGLVDLARHKFSVEFTQSDCKAVYDSAKKLLHAINNGLDKQELLSFPSEANCKYCLYRPACSSFLKYLETDTGFSDVTGMVYNVVLYQNGNVSVFLESGGRRITVTKFLSVKYNELKDCLDKRLNIFNLRKEATDNIYAATKTTMIYE
jgi:CRISPR/Cas system-associated exonuclease Cas4 (RecB family)